MPEQELLKEDRENNVSQRKKQKNFVKANSKTSDENLIVFRCLDKDMPSVVAFVTRIFLWQNPPRKGVSRVNR